MFTTEASSVVPMNERAEWESCQSYIRFYIALNEVLSSQEFEDFLVGFFRRVRVPGLGGKRKQRGAGRKLTRMLRDETTRYQALQTLVEILGDQGWSFVHYVRTTMPNPPEGFDKIGRFGNKKPPGPSPSLRLWPLPDPKNPGGHIHYPEKF